MSAPTYPLYKNSGVQWLGQVPAHWIVSPMKYLAEFKSGGTPDKSKREFWDGDVPWASAKDLKSAELFDTLDHITWNAIEAGAATLVEPGAVLVVVRGMILARTFPIARARASMAINQDLKAVIAKNGVRQNYLAWLLEGSAQETLSRLDEAGHGTKALRMDAWAAMPVPVPPLEEQDGVSSFLDRETAKIDALVEEQKRLIELLKEKRQAVISQAVTKGLDQNVPMKDSGVEWLGDVPAHWIVKPLKHVVEMRSGGTPDKRRPDYWDGDVRWASAKDLKVEALEDTEDHITEAALAEGAATLVDAGAVLVVVRGMILARTFPVVTAKVRMAINQDLKAVTACGSSRNDWLAWLLRASSVETLSRLDEAGHGTKALRMDAWGDMLVAVPPVSEQEAIAGFLQAQCNRLDGLASEAERAVAILDERRSALISAAVTGKIDVRGLAPQPEGAAA